jgi:uncharacterized protein YaiL (DUF2058 family)
MNVGLADAKKARQADKEKRKAARIARKSGAPITDETRDAARQALADKAQRDRELNSRRDAEAQRRAILAQIRQLIENHRVSRRGGDVGFHFTDGTTVKKLYVTRVQQKQLAAGDLAVARLVDGYELVPAPVAQKIAERDGNGVIFCRAAGDSGLTAEERDWYKDYDIPEDLMW